MSSTRISPTVGLWPRSRPDPLGDYIGALDATVELGPTLALPGHGEPIADPVGRARQLIAHHESGSRRRPRRLGPSRRAATRSRSRSSATTSRPAARRFAVAETLSHLERLVLEGGARRIEDDEARYLYFDGRSGRRVASQYLRP